MLGSVTVLCSKGGTKGVHTGQTAGVVLNAKLAAHAQIGGFFKEILGIIDGVLLRHQAYFRDSFILRWQHSSDLKHRASALAVTGGNQRGRNVQKPSALEKHVTAHQQSVSDPSGCAHQIGPWS